MVIVDRDKILMLLRDKNWKELIKELKDNEKFNYLFKEDVTFSPVFNQHFIKEFLKDEDAKSNKLMLAAIYNFHAHESYQFQLSDNDYTIIAKLYAKADKVYDIAKQFLDDPECRKIVEDHERDIENKLKKQEIKKRLGASFRVTKEVGSNLYASCIFQSFNELDCFKAMQKVFSDYIVIPKANLTSIIDALILSSLDDKYVDVFKSSIVDFVVLDRVGYTTKLILELKKESYNKDDLKYDIIKRANIQMYTLEKENGKENEAAYIDILNEIRLNGKSK